MDIFAWVKVADWRLNNIEEQRQIKRFDIYRTPILVLSSGSMQFLDRQEIQ